MTRIRESEKEKKTKVRKSREAQTVTLGDHDRRVNDAAIHLVSEGDETTDGESKTSGMYRIFSRQVCNFAFPNYIPYNVLEKPEKKKKKADERSGGAAAGGASGAEEDVPLIDPVAMIEKKDCVLKSHPIHASGEHTTSLASHSTKYAKALCNLMKSPGLVLLYTFFRVREGIDMIEIIL